MMTAKEKMDIQTRLDALFSLNRLLKLEIAKFWVSKREFDRLRDDFWHIKNKGRKAIDLSDLQKEYFGWISDNYIKPMTMTEKDTRWDAGVKRIVFTYSHLFTPPIEQYFSIDPGAERPLVFNRDMRMNTIPRNELIALYALIYD